MTVMSAPPGIDVERLAAVSRLLVDSGRVVPGMDVDAAGRARSRWWPLPAVGDRDVLASLVPDDTFEGHAGAAAALADAVDGEVRRRLADASVELLARRSGRVGRQTVPQAWLVSLIAPDPYLAASLPPSRVAAFAAALDRWLASGAASLGRARLCLRVHEPVIDVGAEVGAAVDVTGIEADERWAVEILVQDADEPSLLLPVADLWAGAVPFATGAIEDVLTGLGRLTRVAPELASLLDEAAPTEVLLDTATLLDLVRDRTEALADIGVALLLPSWWARRGRLGLRARTSSTSVSTPGVVTEAGFGLDELVAFTWEAALGGEPLTDAELSELERAAAAKQQLVRIRGEWAEVDPTEVAAILSRAGQRGRATAAQLLRAGLGLDTLDAPPGARVDVVATGWLGDLLGDAVHATVTPVGPVPGFVGELRPYQQRGVGWLSFLGRLGLGACLADDMGLGKTAQLIATVLNDAVPGPTLVVSPVSVLGNWARELERFAPSLSVMVHHGAGRLRGDGGDGETDRGDGGDGETDRGGGGGFVAVAGAHDVVLTTYSLVARDVEHLAAVPWARVVLDEAQQVKNPGTAQAKAVAQLRAPRRVALTGTPVENRLAELWSLMQVLNPGLLGTMSSFRTRFARPIEQDHDDAATATLKRITGPFVLRRLKSDRSIIDDLPDKVEQTEHCPLTREQATLYQAVVDELLAAAEATDGIARQGSILAGITRLKQVCNHPAHLLGDGSVLANRSGKLNRVEELLDEIVDAGDKALLFTQYAEWGERLVPHLTRRYGAPPLWLHGGVRRARRDEMVAAFGEPGGPQLFLLSLKAGGTGLNLTAASHVIHLDRWWNPAVEDQATDRAYRIGQRRTVLVHKLVSTGTIEERIDEVITSKRALAQRVVGTGERWVTQLSTDELRAVVSLRRTETA